MAQTTLDPQYNNRNLFSNYYLDKKVKTCAEWTKNDHIAAFSEVKKLYDEERKSFENFNEAQLIEHFLRPIFKKLLFEPEPEEAAGSEFPDFAFFRDKASRDEAHKNKGTISFYTNALAIGEVKKWDTELDGKPIHQLRNYLDITEKKWGILTNGRKWRLFCKEKKRDEYYEVDLPLLLDTNNIEEFKYFFYFFRRDAFLLPENFLESVLHESEDHAKAIGNNLKDNVYKAMKIIADGFFRRPQNNLDKNDEAARERVQKNTNLLLYRLLFLLYAEDRNLLDVKNTKYLNNHSFRRIKKEVEEKRGRIEQGYDYSGTTIWDRLKSLFELINLGSEALSEKEFHVPAYNGGLFDPNKNPELEKWKIGDKYLAEAIHLLTWSEINGAGFVDYSELEIRHLGSIYEGLLEYKLKVAEADIVATGNEWVSLEKYNEGRKQKKTFEEFDEFSRARKGELYLATDKGERKATGSYYTPDYIVNYIVKNTIGAVVDEKWKEADAKKQSFIDATLSVKVLDPAMGSGHFLVGAVEFLADRLLSAAQKDIEAKRLADEPRFSDLDWARREVVAHCIYGVDLNPMAVELAKVSLWLKTISREKPLSFLDHRLKQGNSLIGARLEKLHKYPDLKAKKEEKKVKDAAQQTFEVEIERPFFDKIVKILNSLTDINDDSIENINRKKDIFEKLIASPEYQRIKALANLHTAIYFGVVTTKVDKEPKHGYGDILWALRDNEEEWRKKTNREWFGKARRLAEEKSFFHWELEFPEIFFEGGAPKENPGWDAVVGNPPYVTFGGKEDMQVDEKEVKFYIQRFKSSEYKPNSFSIFYEQFKLWNRTGGIISFIVPRTFLDNFYFRNIRELLLKETEIEIIIETKFDVFGDAKTGGNSIGIFRKNPIPNINHMVTTCILHREDEFEKLTSMISKVQQSFFLSSPAFRFLTTDLSKLKIFQKVKEISEILGNLVEANNGANTGNAADILLSNKMLGTTYKKILEGKDINRYEVNWNGLWINYDPSLKSRLKPEDLKTRQKKVDFALRRPEIFSNPKIIIRQTSDTLIAAFDSEGFITRHSTHLLCPKSDTQISQLYLLALFNSQLLDSIYEMLVPEKG